MGIRKHLKTALGFLAVGSVAFAGAAHADNSKIDVQQDASGKALQVKQAGSTEQFEVGGANNVLYVKQTGKNVTLEGYMHNGANNVGNDISGTKKYLIMNATDGSNKYDIDFTVHQDGSDKINVKSVNLSGGGSKEGEIDAAGKITFTVDQNAGSNTINVGYVNSASSIDATVTQQDGATLNLNYLETTSNEISLTVNQSGGSSNEITLGDDTVSVKAGKIVAKITQQGGDSNKVKMYDFNVGGTLTVKGYSSDTLTQNGNSNTVMMHGVDSASDAELAISQSGDSNQVHVDKLSAVAGQIKFDVNQENGSNEVNISEMTSDSNDISAKINQTGGQDIFKVDNKIEADGDVTVNVEQSASSDTVDINKITSSSGSVNATINQSSSDSEFVISDEVFADKNVTINVTQENGNKNKFKINHIKSTNEGVDIKVVMSGSNNSIGGIDISGSTANDLSANYDNGLIQEAGDQASLTANIYGNGNTVALKQIAGTTATFNLNVGSSSSPVTNNNVYVYQDASTSAKADIDITSSNNTLRLYQKSTGAFVYADIDITSSGNDISITQNAGAEGASYVKVY